MIIDTYHENSPTLLRDDTRKRNISSTNFGYGSAFSLSEMGGNNRHWWGEEGDRSINPPVSL